MNNITDVQKIYELSRIWKEAAYNFAFWDRVDINWDEEYKKTIARVLGTKDIYEYYRELMRFAALLGDGHTNVTMPNELYQDPEYFSVLPISLYRFGNEITVLNTTEELKDRIPPYSRIKKINGADAADHIRENCYPYFWHENEAACGISAMNELMFGRRGSSAVFTFEHDGREFDIRLEREDPAKMTWISTDFSYKNPHEKKVLSSADSFKVSLNDDDIAVIKMTSFADNSVPEKIYECFDELKDAIGYIIDIRGNGGGNSVNADAVAELFVEGVFRICVAETQVYEPTYKALSVFRDDLRDIPLDVLDERYAEDKKSIKIGRTARNMFYVTSEEEDELEDKSPGKLKGPVVVLMNEYTASAAEDFVDVMKMYTDAVFIGKNTAGTSGQPLFEQLESGGSFRICTCRCIAQNGEDIYNKGFAPDIEISQTAEDFAAGHDIALEKAFEIIKNKTVQ